MIYEGLEQTALINFINNTTQQQQDNMKKTYYWFMNLASEGASYWPSYTSNEYE
jgi:hypothetical protein